MNDKNKNKQKVGPQGTQVFDLSEVESLLAKEMQQHAEKGLGTPTLVGLTKPYSGKHIPLEGTRFQVGRTASSDIRIDEPSVSSTHAKILFIDNVWKVSNLLSSNGTYVNGDKVAESEIFPGDRVRFGGVEFVFTMIEHSGDKNKNDSSMGLVTKVLVYGIITLGILGAGAYFLL